VYGKWGASLDDIWATFRAVFGILGILVVSYGVVVGWPG
jgi:hypothetical protein